MPNSTTTKQLPAAEQLPTTNAVMDPFAICNVDYEDAANFQWSVFELNYEIDDGKEWAQWFQPVLVPVNGGKTIVYMLLNANFPSNQYAEAITATVTGSFESIPDFKSQRNVGFLDGKDVFRFANLCHQVNKEGKVNGGALAFKGKFWDMVKKEEIILNQREFLQHFKRVREAGE